MRISIVEKETTETTCKNNLFFLAAQPRGALETGRGCARIAKVVFSSCHGCFQKNLQARSVGNVDDWELGPCPRPRLRANHRRLTGVRGMGECAEEAPLRREDSAKPNPKGAQASANPIFKSSNHLLHIYTSTRPIHGPLDRLCGF